VWSLFFFLVSHVFCVLFSTYRYRSYIKNEEYMYIPGFIFLRSWILCDTRTTFEKRKYFKNITSIYQATEIYLIELFFSFSLLVCLFSNLYEATKFINSGTSTVSAQKLKDLNRLTTEKMRTTEKNRPLDL